jgi:predicted phage tail protein
VIAEDVAGLANHEFAPATDLAPNTKYYWRVRSYNTDSKYSAWSVVRYFRTTLLPPTLTNPPDLSTVSSLRPTFDWGDVTGASGYTIQVSKNNTFTLVIQTGTVTGGANSQFTPLVSLPVNTTLYWRARANGTNGPSLWSSPTRSFTTPNPPGVPLPLSPALNALLTSTTPTLTWSAPVLYPTQPGTAPFMQYEVEIATDAAFTAIVQTGVVANYNTPQYSVAPALNPNMKYYWRVRSVDMLNHTSIWSTVRYFRTALAAPVLILPLDNTNPTGSRKPLLDWGDVTGAASYTIQVSRNNTFTLLVVNATVVGVANSQYTPLVNLPASTTLYWRVRANGVNGPSLWSSPTWSFVTPP